ncbi:MAG: DUF6088 family protein [Longimicrobiaceae bacterium]
MNAMTDKIMRRVRGKGRGSVWTPMDFLDNGSRASVDQALSRLVKQGLLRRLARGVYSYPRMSRRLGALTPSPDVIATALVNSRHCRIQVSGARAANELGLTTQVPAKAVYLTDGPARAVRVGRQEIRLKHVPSTRLVAAGTKAGMVLEALRHLGPDVDPRTIKRLGTQLSRRDKQTLNQNLRAVSARVRLIAEQIART